MSSPTSSGILENLPLLWTGYIRSPKQDKEKMLRHVDKICLFFFKQTKILQACVRKNHKEIVTSATTTRLDRYTPIKVTTKYVLCRKTRKSVARFGARTKWQATLCCVNKMQVVQVGTGDLTCSVWYNMHLCRMREELPWLRRRRSKGANSQECQLCGYRRILEDKQFLSIIACSTVSRISTFEEAHDDLQCCWQYTCILAIS